MNYYVYQMSPAHQEYMGTLEYAGYRAGLLAIRCEEEREEAIQNVTRHYLCVLRFLEHETRSRVVRVLCQPLPCHHGLAMGFVEDAQDGWAAMYVASPVPISHLDAAWFATLTWHPSDELEVQHRDGHSRPLIDVQRSMENQASLLVKERSRRRAIL